ncbi:MAG: diguanylate cyclase [Agathobacter sp.]|nr:diguanylate cyclase [Agathobacter sp.]
MKEIIEKCKNNLKYGGIKEEEYLEITDEIREKNRSTLEMTSLCLMFMFAGLFLASLFSSIMESNRLAYASLDIIFSIVYLLCRRMKKGGMKAVMPLWYAAMTIMFAYAVILNTVVRNDISATTLCLIMIVAPLLILDQPWRVLCYFTLVVIAFIPINFHQKSFYLAFTDTVNILCCLFLGSVIHFGIIRTKLREMMQRHYIEQQRDTDKLTECLTKAAFEFRLRDSMKEQNNQGILLVMDVDCFKGINDSYGHIFGDVVLHTVGHSLRGIFSEEALCGRFGGDEFVVWLPGTWSRREISDLLKMLLDRVHAIQTPDGHKKITLSIGAAGFPENGHDYDLIP